MDRILDSVEGRLSDTGLGLSGPGEALLRAILEALPESLLLTAGTEGLPVAANSALEALWEIQGPLRGEAGAASLRSRMEALAADAGSVASLWARRAELPGEGQEIQSYLLLKDGRQVRWRSRRVAAATTGPDELVLHLFEEVTPAHQPPPGGDDLFRLSFEMAAVGMTLVSADYRFLRANRSFCSMLGYSERDLLQLHLADLFDAGDLGIDGGWGHSPQSAETFHMERRVRTQSGGRLWVELSISTVRDEQGRPVYFIALAEDITDRKRLEEEQARRTRELQVLATTDPLTGLYNHRFMQEFLLHRLSESRRVGQPVSVLMLDIDEFRSLNEEHGHDAGNRALRGVADAIRGALRGHDVACRFGGDEFVIILGGASLPQATATAERLRSRLSECAALGALGPITCSVGVASFPLHASTAASLLKAADLALYQAKRTGKNRICSFEPSPQLRTPDHLDLLGSGLQGANADAVAALVTAVDLRDRYTGAHCQRVGRLSVELGMRLGCTDEELETLRLGASLLDVGKIGLPDYLLTKTGRLTSEEWELMRQHPEWGERLLRRTALPAAVHQLVRHHHERLDGSGYPDQLRGDELSLLVRIVNVADVACALREDRPHRRAWPKERVREYLQRHAGSRLDQRVVDAYCELFTG